MFHISERLKTVASMVPKCNTAADIGTDHGYVPAYLLLSEKCERVIASDIAAGPCLAAEQTRNKYGLQLNMDIRMAPGLQGLYPGEADAVVIAGMGGATIAAILEECPEVTEAIRTFVLQPMNASAMLRQWLSGHCFRIVDEQLCMENGHIYVIIQTVHSLEKHLLSEIEAELGPCILKKQPALWRESATGKAEQLQNMLAQMQGSETAKSSEKFKKTAQLLEEIKRLL